MLKERKKGQARVIEVKEYQNTRNSEYMLCFACWLLLRLSRATLYEMPQTQGDEEMENNNINKEKTRDDITGKRAFTDIIFWSFACYSWNANCIW